MTQFAVLMAAHSQYRAIYTGIAQKLKAQGAEVHLYVALRQQASFYESRDPDLYGSVNVANRLYTVCKEKVSDPEAVLEIARKNEVRLGTSYNSIMSSDRHLGRGFALGGFNHPRSRISQETSYIQAVHAINETIAFWQGEIDRTGAQVILNAGKIAALVARANNISYRTLAASRYKNYHYWAVNEFFENPAFEEAFAKAADQSKAVSDFENPYTAHLQMRRYFQNRLRLQGAVKDIVLTLARHAYWRMRGYDKAKGYYVFDEIRYLWRRYRDVKRVGDRSIPLSELAGKPFIYYPLHTEPETALQTLSPEYFFQLSSIATLARDAPAGTLVVVKETVAALGRRPANFYDQIAEFKNVVFVDPNEFGLKVAAECDVVATITGTGGFEGAALGKPVISFGLHNIYGMVPHVKVVRGPGDVKAALDWALGDDFDSEQSKKDGIRFLNAIIGPSFDMGSFSVTAPDAIDPESLEMAFDNLVRSTPELRQFTKAAA